MDTTGHQPTLVPFFTIEDGLRHEETLLEEVRNGNKSFACELWQTNQCLVAPRSFERNVQFETAKKLSADNHWPVYTRSTGGDVTPQGPGIVNVSVVCAMPGNRKQSVESSYIQFCKPVVDALKKIGLYGEYGEIPNAFCNGKYNINVDGHKLVGTAQRWRRLRSGVEGYALLFHALILISPPDRQSISAINYFLQHCGEERQIDAEVHTGLENYISPGSVKLFFSEIKVAYAQKFA